MEVVMKEGEDGACNKVQNSGLGPDLDQTRKMIQKRARNQLQTQEFLDRKGKNPNMVQKKSKILSMPWVQNQVLAQTSTSSKWK